MSFKSIDNEVVCAYVEVLAERLKSPATIKNYISALNITYRRMGICPHAFIHDSVKRALAATDKTVKHIPVRAFAVTPPLLKKLLYIMSDLTHFKTIKCVFLFMYFTMLRQSNFAPISQKLFDPDRHLTRSDVNYYNKGLRIRVKWEKNLQNSTRMSYVSIPFATDPQLCPVLSYIEMVNSIPARSPDGALAIFHDGKPIPLYYFQKIWKKAVTCIGLDPAHYRLHGLRRGAATYIAGASTQARDRLKAYGRWSSNVFLNYVEDPTACPVYEALSKI